MLPKFFSNLYTRSASPKTQNHIDTCIDGSIDTCITNVRSHFSEDLKKLCARVCEECL